MAGLNTQLGYQKPRQPTYGLPGAARQGQPSSGVTRALAGVAQPPPAAPSYRNPYDENPGGTGSLFTQPAVPPVQATAPASTPASYTPQAAAAPAAPAGYTFNLETDPILQQIHATAARQRSEAEAGALEQRKQLAIQYGDQGYGSGIDKSTGDAAAQNPFSITKNLANQYDTQGHNANEQLNQHNLFYSGARINELAQMLKDYQQQQAVAAGQFQQGIGQIGQNRVGALMGADQAEQGGYNDAWSRALAAALASGAGGAPANAPTQTANGVTYAGYPSQGSPIPTNPDTSGMTQADAVAAQQAAAGAMTTWNQQQAGAPAPTAAPAAVPPELLRLLLR